jgi:pyruvyl transferase EpsO
VNAPVFVDTASTALSDTALLARQRSEIDAFFDLYIPADRPVALLQYGWDANVGNHMMWLAVRDYLQRRGIAIAYAAHQFNFRLEDMVRAVGDGPILFLGGVSVSRLWPSHAQVKRIVAAACPDNRLISLPSTMLFVDDEDRQEAGSIFGRHRDVVMMARDPVSARSAREAFPQSVAVATIHDSTFLLPPQPRRGTPAHDIIWLSRDDHESTGAAAPGELDTFDWADVTHFGHRLANAVLNRARKYAPMSAPLANPLFNACLDWVSRHVVDRGNRKLDTGKVLVTDRLHPHVLAALRSQPCVLLPDRYGKNRAVYEYSTRNYSSVHWADTPRQALELARELAAVDRPARAAAPRHGALLAAGAGLLEPGQLVPEQVEILQTIAAVASTLALAA